MGKQQKKIGWLLEIVLYEALGLCIAVACDIARKKGAEVKIVDLADFEMPLYSGNKIKSLLFDTIFKYSVN